MLAKRIASGRDRVVRGEVNETESAASHAPAWSGLLQSPANCESDACPRPRSADAMALANPGWAPQGVMDATTDPSPCWAGTTIDRIREYSCEAEIPHPGSRADKPARAAGRARRRWVAWFRMNRGQRLAEFGRGCNRILLPTFLRAAAPDP